MKIPNMMPNRSSIAFKASLVFGAIFLMEAFYLGGLAIMVEQSKIQFEREREARGVLLSLDGAIRSTQELLEGLLKHAAAGRGKGFLELYYSALAALPKHITRLDTVNVENPSDREMLDQISERIRELPQATETVRMSQTTQDWQKASFGILRMDSLYHELCPLVEEMSQRYRRIDQDVSVALTEQSRMLLNIAVFFGFGVNAVVALVFYHVFASRLAKRLQVVADDMYRVASGKALEQKELGDDEIDRLSLSLRTMASKIESFRAKERTMLNNAPSFICALDRNTSIVEVSEGCSALWGYTQDELLGRKLTTMVVDDDDVTSESIAEAFEKSVLVSFENAVKKADGSIIELSWRCSLSEDASTAICVAQDMTVRNARLRLLLQRQEEFREIVDGMPLAVVACDRSFVISSVNPSTQNFFQFQPAELLGKNLSILLTGTQLASDAAAAQLDGIMTIAEKQPIELNAWRSDGSQLPVELNTRRYETGGATTYLATFQDVSTRMEIERVKREFVAMLSHDLRSPLTALRGTLDLIHAEAERNKAIQAGKASTLTEEINDTKADTTLKPAEKTIEPINRAQKIVEELVHLMNDFLDMEKFESGMAVLDLKPVGIKDLLYEATNNLDDVDASRVVPKVSVTFANELMIDPMRMILSLSNLLAIVARNANPDFPVELTVENDGEGLAIKISAKNLRLPSTVKEALFSRYVLLTPDLSGAGSSSGIGLALSRAVVQAHGGSLAIERSFDRDVIRLRLPSTAVKHIDSLS